MASYNWWRRNPKRKTLPKSVDLIQRIRNGDYDTSQYLEEAEDELRMLEKLKSEEIQRGEMMGLDKSTVSENIFSKTDTYRRRYNRLMKDFEEDEFKIIQKLKKDLKKEFGKDHWEYLYTMWLDNKLDDLTIEQIYNEYKLIKKSGLKLG